MHLSDSDSTTPVAGEDAQDRSLEELHNYLVQHGIIEAEESSVTLNREFQEGGKYIEENQYSTHPDLADDCSSCSFDLVSRTSVTLNSVSVIEDDVNERAISPQAYDQRRKVGLPIQQDNSLNPASLSYSSPVIAPYNAGHDPQANEAISFREFSPPLNSLPNHIPASTNYVDAIASSELRSSGICLESDIFCSKSYDARTLQPSDFWEQNFTEQESLNSSRYSALPDLRLCRETEAFVRFESESSEHSNEACTSLAKFHARSGPPTDAHCSKRKKLQRKRRRLISRLREQDIEQVLQLYFFSDPSSSSLSPLCSPDVTPIPSLPGSPVICSRMREVSCSFWHNRPDICSVCSLTPGLLLPRSLDSIVHALNSVKNILLLVTYLENLLENCCVFHVEIVGLNYK